MRELKTDYKPDEVGLKALIKEFLTETRETTTDMRGIWKDCLLELVMISRYVNAPKRWASVLRDHIRAANGACHQDFTPKTGRLRYIRGLNRRRLYFTRYFKMYAKYAGVILLWDRNYRAPCNPKEVKSVLLLQHVNTMGDNLMDTGFIKCLHQAGIQVDCLLASNSRDIMANNPYIRKIYEVDPVSTHRYLNDPVWPLPLDIQWQLHNNDYDLIIDPAVAVWPPHIFRMLDQIKPKAVLGFNRWPSVNWYAKSFDFDIHTTHVSKRWDIIADYLELDKSALATYDLHIKPNVEQEAIDYLAQFDRRVVVFNLFGSMEERCLSQAQMLEIVKGLHTEHDDIHIVLFDHMGVITCDLPEHVSINPLKSLHHAAAIIKHADAIITPDTIICHFGCMWKKPLLAIYRDVGSNNVLWGPGYDEATQLFVPPTYLSKQKNLPAKVVKAMRPILDPTYIPEVDTDIIEDDEDEITRQQNVIKRK